MFRLLLVLSESKPGKNAINTMSNLLCTHIITAPLENEMVTVLDSWSISSVLSVSRAMTSDAPLITDFMVDDISR